MTENGISSFIRRNWEMVFPLAACLLAFVLRWHFLSFYHFPMMIHEQDAVGYMDTARNILQLAPLNMAGRPPGYPLVIALFALLPLKLEYAARLASIFMDAAVVLPLYFLARGYLSRVPSFAVCLLWASFSFALYFSTSPLSQSSYLFYLLSGIILLRQGLEKSDKGRLFVSGGMFALSFLARPEGIVGFACGLLLSLLPLLKRGGHSKKKGVAPLVFLLGFLLLSGPYFVAFHSQLGYWGITAKSEAALKTQDGTLVLNSKGELSKTAQGVSVWKEYYGTLPVFVDAVETNIEAYAAVYFRTFPVWIHLVSLAGFLVIARQRIRALPYLLILPAVLTPNFVVNVSKTHSYLYAAFPLLFISLVAGLSAGCRAVCWGMNRYLSAARVPLYEAASGAAMLIMVGYLSFGAYCLADVSYQDEAEEAYKTEMIYKQAGEFIKANSHKNDVIMTRWGLVGYFADRPVVTLPKGGVREVIEYGRRNGASYLLIDTNSVLSRRQELMELLQPLEGKGVDPSYGLEIVNRNYYPDAGGYVVYRYLPQRS